MRKILLTVLAAFLLAAGVRAQVTGITPDSAYQGQSLHTTITSSALFMTGSSPQGNIWNIILKNASDSGFAISDSTNVVNSNTATSFFNIPSGILTGLYNLIVRIGTAGSTTDYSATNAFRVTPASATVTGTVFEDYNHNGIQDAGEPGMGGYTVRLRQAGNFTVSDSLGHYSIGGFPGADTAELVHPADDAYSSTSNAVHPLVVLAGANPNINFGLVLSKFLVSISPATTPAGQNFSAVVLDSSVLQHARIVSLVLQRGYNICYASAFSATDSAHISATWNVPGRWAGGRYDVALTVFDTVLNLSRSYRLDTAVYVNGPTGLISGYAFVDSLGTGIRTAGEPGLSGIYISISGPVSETTLTDSNGYYEFDGLPNGNYFVSIWSPGIYWTTCGSLNSFLPPYANDTISNDSILNSNFGQQVNVTGNYDLMIHPGWLPAVPGFDREYWIFYGNEGSSAVNNVTITFQYDPSLIYDSSIYAPTTIDLINHTLTWNVGTLHSGDLWLGGFVNNFFIYFTVPRSDTAGQLLYSSFNISPTSGDCNTGNNFVTDVSPVTSSHDPNNKQANPYGSFVYSSDSAINYTITFQNTGTAPTHFVIVRDTLDPSLDWRTAILTGSSGPCTFNNNNGALSFVLNPLVLPDSAADPIHSIGFVTYSVKVKPGLALGTYIRNTAHVFFDYNPEVLTNTTTNTVTNPLAILSAKASGMVEVSPNPFTESTSISFSNSNSDEYSLQLFDMEGSLVRSLSTSGNRFEILRNGLAEGVYLYKLTNNRTKISVKGKVIAE